MPTIKEEVERVKRIAQQQSGKPDSFADLMGRVTQGQYKPLTKATPYEEVLANYELPFPLYKFQANIVNDLAPALNAGVYADPGTGKTVTATAMTLFRFIIGMANKAVVIVPPIIIDQWAAFLGTIPGLSVQMYRGTPPQRKRLHLGKDTFTVVGIQIFKRDYERFASAFGKDTAVLVDEAHCIKNVSSDNYRKVSRFALDKSLTLLTGTPISTPEDAYAYVKLIAPGIYRNKAQFMNIHAGERDFFNNVVSWKNLDVLSENMTVNAARVLKEDVLEDLPDITYTPLPYNLDPSHMALYKRLAEEQLLQIGDGKLDATSSQRLMHALGQIVCNWDYFADDPGKRSACFDVIDLVMDEVGGKGKLMIFATYRMTNKRLLAYLQKYGAVAAYGDQTPAQNLASVSMFISNPECRVFIAQPTSAGVGLDGLQDVCQDGLFLEIPSVRDFHQAVARLHRAGQKSNVNIRIATAQNTLQVYKAQGLMDKDALVNKVIRNKQDLRDAIFGRNT